MNGEWIGPFESEEDCRRSQQDATVPATGCVFWPAPTGVPDDPRGAGYYYKVYPGAVASDDVGLGDDSTLRTHLETVGERFDVLPELLESSNRILDEHGFEEIKAKIEAIGEQEGGNPPDDLEKELYKLWEKIERLRRGEDFERKFPWRRQISLDLLISILVELLDILRKLYGRSVPPRGGPGGGPRT